LRSTQVVRLFSAGWLNSTMVEVMLIIFAKS
jgi:hypothetical protein